MKLVAPIGLLALCAACVVACDKEQSSSSSTEVTAAPKAAAAAPAAPAAPAKAAFVQKGVQEGRVVVGYLQDASDPGQCAVATDKPEKKDDFKKNGAELAKMLKGKLVDACPTDHVVGTCDIGFGILDNYSAPQWNADTAKAHCAKNKGKWVD